MKRATGRAVLAGAALSTFFLFKPMLKLQDHVKSIWHKTTDQRINDADHNNTQDSIFDNLENSMEQMNEATKKRADSLKNNKTSSIDPYEFQYDIDNAADGVKQTVVAELVELDDQTIALTSLSFPDMAENAQDMGVDADHMNVKPAPQLQQTPTA